MRDENPTAPTSPAIPAHLKGWRRIFAFFRTAAVRATGREIATPDDARELLEFGTMGMPPVEAWRVAARSGTRDPPPPRLSLQRKSAS